MVAQWVKGLSDRLLSRSGKAGGDRPAVHEPAFESFPHHRHVRLITFNIQVGITTGAYRHYLTRSWQHLLPTPQRLRNLDRIAVLLKQYDVVALQECDGGSIRSGNVNQVQYLAERSGHPFWYQQLNRNLGRFAQHSNGLLSRFKPLSVEEVRLPGLIPGRGAIVVKYGRPEEPLILVMLHLALGAKTQRQQLAHVVDVIRPYRHVVFMGDFNCHADRLLQETALGDLDLHPLPVQMKSFPSWRPERSLDHILVSSTLKIRNAGVVCFPVSDHLPVALDIGLPEGYFGEG
ncbi:MAG: endonuclease/exonuclease/phosphatase family protein [Hahellaceae bacterium]|jgi:endonuclease/exonuclease/phosphatase family metal-dependent hydrolase|nr:endonuclease/exonuclease/phosphatase family protein [Hahellaceae bacterium]